MPLPDFSKAKKYGILPNVNCLANIYARINKIEQGKGQVTMLHDEQKEFNEAHAEIKRLTEELSSEKSLETPFANFNIKIGTDLNFVSSKDEYGVQIADLLAGTFVRHVNAVSNDSDIHDEFGKAYKMLIENESPKIGINMVIPSRDVGKLLLQSRGC